MYLKGCVGVTAFSTGKEESDGRKGEGRGGGKRGGYMPSLYYLEYK